MSSGLRLDLSTSREDTQQHVVNNINVHPGQYVCTKLTALELRKYVAAVSEMDRSDLPDLDTRRRA